MVFRGENAGLGRGGLGSNLLGWVEWKYVSVRVKVLYHSLYEAVGFGRDWFAHAPQQEFGAMLIRSIRSRIQRQPSYTSAWPRLRQNNKKAYMNSYIDIEV